MKILVTGFDPFDKEPINPSIEAVKRLADEINNAKIIKLMIPTVHTKSVEVIEKAIIEHNPDVVISVGQAGGRFDITPERVAINLDDFRIPDNEGFQCFDQTIKEDGESAYFSNLPVKAMVEEIKSAQISASLSNTAGTFVCNHVMYNILYLIDKKYPNLKGGFIHIPFIREQVINKPNTPAMSLDEIVIGLTAAITAVTKYSNDLKVELGEIN